MRSEDFEEVAQQVFNLIEGKGYEPSTYKEVV